MNQVPEEKKESLTKVFAILGFLALIIFAVWLAVQIVRVIPSAFSSLASIAEVVYNYRGTQELEVATPKTVFNAGESFTISWNTMRGEGTYAFMYTCTDGVSVDMRKPDGSIEAVACDTKVSLGTATSIELLVASEKARFVDLPYTITFTRNGETEAVTAKTTTITIVNASVPTAGVATETEEDDTDTVEDTTVTTPAPTTGDTSPVYTPGKPKTVTKYVYITPVSDPKGVVDLQVTYLGVGIIKNKVFIPQSSIDSDDAGAVQFEVKNIGTKTAEDWDYEAELPASISYKSGDQKPLKPNERAVITLGFEGLSKSGTEVISVEVDAKGDVKNSNNDFSKTVKITN